MSKLLEAQKAYGLEVDKLEALAESGGEAYDAQLTAVKELEQKVKRLKEAQALKAESAETLAPGTGGGAPSGSPSVPAQAKAPTEKGGNLSRAIVALAAEKGNKRHAMEFAREKWGDSAEPVVKALAATVGQSGGFLVPDDFRNELIELLRPASVIMSSGPRIIDMPRGNIEIPRVLTGASANYVGENTNIPKSEQTFGMISLSVKKLACLVPISNDMMRFPTINTDSFVRTDVVAAMSQRADLALLRGDGTQFSPRGLRSWAIEAGQRFTAQTSPDLAKVTSDLSRMELALAESNLPERNLVWLMSPRSWAYISNLRDGNGNFSFPSTTPRMLRGRPVKLTTQIPNNIGGATNGSEIYLVEMSEFIIGESMNVEVEVFNGGTYWDGAQLISGISQDQTVIRAIMEHDAAMRQPLGVAMLDDVRWIV